MFKRLKPITLARQSAVSLDTGNQDGTAILGFPPSRGQRRTKSILMR